MAPPGIPGTDFWNQLRVTGSPRASIIAAISERALLFPLALLLILSLSLSRFATNPRFFLLLFLLPLVPIFFLFFQEGVEGRNVPNDRENRAADRRENEKRAARSFSTLLKRKNRGSTTVWEIPFRGCDCAVRNMAARANYYASGYTLSLLHGKGKEITIFSFSPLPLLLFFPGIE